MKEPGTINLVGSLLGERRRDEAMMIIQSILDKHKEENLMVHLGFDYEKGFKEAMKLIWESGA